MKYFWTLTAALLAASAAHSVEPVRELVCAYTVIAANGESQVVPSVTLSVLDQVTTTSGFKLPADAPPKVSSIMCARSSPIPVKNDAWVVDAGYPLFISAPAGDGKSRVFRLDRPKDRLHLQAVQGTMTADEKADAEIILMRMNAVIRPQAKPAG